MLVKQLNTCAAVIVMMIGLTANASMVNSQDSLRKHKQPRNLLKNRVLKRPYRLASNYRDTSSRYGMFKTDVYQTDLRNWEFRTAPVALIARWYTLDVSYRFTQHIAFGPSAVIYDAADRGNMMSPSYKGNAFGFNSNYYFSSVEKSGWYSSFHAYQESYRSYPEGRPSYDDRKGYRGNIIAGYQTKWSRFNLLTGAGAEYTNHNVISTDLFDGTQPATRESGWGLAVEIKLGFEI